MEVVARNQTRYKLSTGLVLPHVIQDGVDMGVATPAEEAFWAEIERLRAQLAEAKGQC